MKTTDLSLLLAPLALAACASEPRPTLERGWIGGRFADVSRRSESDITNRRREDVVGMPDSAPGDHGALVTAAYDGTPVARAGLAPGDLVLSLDGRPVDGALDLRERVEALVPGSRAQIGFWRAGEMSSAEIVAGRETYESMGTLTVGIQLEGTLDLWPFDDGIDVFGLIRVGKDHDRRDLDGPVTAYRRQVSADGEIDVPPQELFEAYVVPLGLGKGKRVLRQETAP